MNVPTVIASLSVTIYIRPVLCVYIQFIYQLVSIAEASDDGMR